MSQGLRPEMYGRAVAGSSLGPELIPVWWTAKTTGITNEQCQWHVLLLIIAAQCLLHIAFSHSNIMCLGHLASYPITPSISLVPPLLPLLLSFVSALMSTAHTRFYAIHHFLNGSIWKSLKGNLWNIWGLFDFLIYQKIHLGKDNGVQGLLRGECTMVCSSQGNQCFPGAMAYKVGYHMKARLK